MRVFTHSGDIGDTIYALPTLRAKGPSKLLLFNYPGRTYQAMTQSRRDKLAPLIEYQEYITSCEFTHEFVDSSLNGWRDHLRNTGNTIDAHLATHGLGWEHRIEPWLKVPSVIKTTSVVMAWTPRHHSFDFPWRRFLETYEGDISYLGFPDDLEDFNNRYSQGLEPPKMVDAHDFMTIAQIVAGCKLYVGNLTSITAVAEGLKHYSIIEGYHSHTANNIYRPGLTVAYTSKVEFPKL